MRKGRQKLDWKAIGFGRVLGLKYQCIIYFLVPISTLILVSH